MKTGMEYKRRLTAKVSSRGRKHRPKGQIIPRENLLLSDLEYFFFMVFDFCFGLVVDIREQVDLDVNETLAVAKEKNIRHPINPRTKKPAVMTTDLLVNFSKDGSEELVACTVKFEKDLTLPNLKKFEIERVIYEEKRKVKWFIFTERERSPLLLKNLTYLRPHFHNNLNPQAIFFSEGLRDFSDTSLDLRQIINSVGEKMEISKSDSYQLYLHLLARKIVKFDYYNKDVTALNSISDLKL